MYSLALDDVVEVFFEPIELQSEMAVFVEDGVAGFAYRSVEDFDQSGA